MMSSLAIRKIPRPDNVREVMFENGDTADIITVILYADQFIKADTAKFARYLKGRTDYETCRNIWRFVKQYIRYVPDRDGHERIKSPSKTVYDGYGDCKSMSLLVGSLMKNLGIVYDYRFTGYDKDRDVRHVYCIAFVDGREVAVDAVHTDFDDEVDYAFKKDYQPQYSSGKVAGIRSIPSSSFWKNAAIITGFLLAGRLIFIND